MRINIKHRYKDEISHCKRCNCMTKTIKDKSEALRCAKCGGKK